MVNELVTKFSFIGDLKPQQTFNENLNKSIGLLAGMVGAIGALGVGMFAFTSSTLEPIDKLNDFSKEIGVNIEAIQELGFTAQLNGSSMEAMQSSLAGISKSIGDASRDIGRGKQAYEDLGISVKNTDGTLKTADAMLIELRTRMQELKYSEAQIKSIGFNLGIDPSLLQFLKMTGDEIDDFRLKARELGVVTGENAEKAADFMDALDTLKYAMSAIRSFVAIGLAPAFTDIIEKMVNWLSANRDLIINGLQYMSSIIVSLGEAVVRLAPIITMIGGLFLAWKIQAIGLRAVLATIFSPITLIIGAVIAVALVIDDLIVAFQGGESVINDFTKAWLGIDIGDVMRNMVDSVFSAKDDIVETFSSMFYWLSETWNSFSISNVMRKMVDSVNVAIDKIKNAFKSMFTWLSDMWNNSEMKKTLEWIGGGVSKGYESVKDTVSNIDMKKVSNLMFEPIQFPKAEPIQFPKAEPIQFPKAEPIQFPKAEPIQFPKAEPIQFPKAEPIQFPKAEPIQFPKAEPIQFPKETSQPNFMNIKPFQPSPITSNYAGSTIQQNVNVTVATTDPIRAGQAVSDSLQGQLQDASKQFNRGGM